MRVLVVCLILSAATSVPAAIGPFPLDEAPAAFVQSPSPNTSLRRLRVLTWNVNAARTAAGVAGLPEQLDAMWAARPDVVALQHVPASGDVPALIETGLETRSGRPWSGSFHPDDTAAGEGSMLLTWLPGAEASVTRLGETGGSTPARPAAAVGLSVTVNAQAVTIVTARLDPSDASNRALQLGQLQQWLEGFPVRRIAAADFAFDPGDAAWTSWRAGYQDAWHALVFSATQESGWTIDSRPETGGPARLDYHWYAQVTPTEISLIKSGVSSHHALVADYEVR